MEPSLSIADITLAMELFNGTIPFYSRYNIGYDKLHQLQYTRILRDKTMADKLMYIPNDIYYIIHKITPYVDYNQLLKRLDTQINLVPKFVKPAINNMLL